MDVHTSSINGLNNAFSDVETFFQYRTESGRTDLGVGSKEQFSNLHAQLENLMESISFGEAKVESHHITIKDADKPLVVNIKGYYQALIDLDFKLACNLKKGQECDGGEVSQVSDRYADVAKAIPYRFEADDESVLFFVDYQDHNKAPEKFLVRAQENKNGFETAVLEEVYSVDFFDNGSSIRSTNRSGENMLIYKDQSASEIIINRTHDGSKYEKGGGGFTFEGLFKNRYIFYGEYGYEFGQGVMYDLEKKENVYEGYIGGSVDPFVDESGKYFVVCGGYWGMGMGSGLIAYDLDSWEIVYDSNKYLASLHGKDVVGHGYETRECTRNEKANSVSYIITTKDDRYRESTLVQSTVNLNDLETSFTVNKISDFTEKVLVGHAHENYWVKTETAEGRVILYAYRIVDDQRQVVINLASIETVIDSCPYQPHTSNVNDCYFSDFQTDNGLLSFVKNSNTRERKIYDLEDQKFLGQVPASHNFEYDSDRDQYYVYQWQEDNHHFGQIGEDIFLIVNHDFSISKDLTDDIREIYNQFNDAYYKSVHVSDEGVIRVMLYFKEVSGNHKVREYVYDYISDIFKEEHHK